MSAKTVFISYRRDATGKAFARSIKQELTRHGYDVFFDVDSIDAGKWEQQILTEVPKRSHFLLLITPGSLDRCADEDDWVRREFETAVKSRRNIVPVREESVDLNELISKSPEAIKAVFDFQIATIRQDGFENDIRDLTQRYIPPHKAPQELQPQSTPFKADISRIVKYAPAELIGRVDETEVLKDAWEKVAGGETKRPFVMTFVALGGEGKTSLVSKWSAELAHQGWPGCDSAFAWSFYSQGTKEQYAGSSDLFLKEALNFFGDEVDKEFAASNASAFEKGQRLARLVGRQRNLLILDGLEPLQYPPSSTAFSPGQLKDQGIAKLLRDLATANRGLCVVTTRYSIPDLNAFMGSTVHQEKLTRLSREHGVAFLKKLGVYGSERRNLSLKDGDDTSEKVNELEKLVEDVKGHALTLQIMGGFLKRAFGGDVRQRDRVRFEKADEKIDGGHAFRAMAAYAKWMEDGTDEAKRELAILRLMGLFDRPASHDCIEALLQSPSIAGLTEPLVGVAQDDWQFSLDALDSADLLAVNRESSGALLSLDTHPHIREYFARQLRTQQPGAFRAGHRRLYKHLISTTHEGERPTLEDLQPLYQAVTHGCHAGLQQDAWDEVYRQRIIRNDEFYSTTKLGAFGADLGAFACFYDEPWRHLPPTLDSVARGSILALTSTRLRALGRLTESLEPMRASLDSSVQASNWTHAARRASNLSELELTLGEVAGAIAHGEHSVTYADRSGVAFERMSKRTTHADALHQGGRRTESETVFRAAEEMQNETQTYYPLLYSVQGFQYCDLLLAAPLRAAWKIMLNPEASQKSELAQQCRSVSQRAAQTLKWAQQENDPSLLNVAVDHLTLGRAALYAAILSTRSGREKVHPEILTVKAEDRKESQSVGTSAAMEINAAVASLRRAGTMHHLPQALLTRAWLRFLTEARIGHDSAQEDLDEAWDIAERGPMRLFMVDIHLYRARLFGPVGGKMVSDDERTEYPWNKNPDGSPRGPLDDLKAARKLIEQCGYWRRKEELEDAEEASKNW